MFKKQSKSPLQSALNTAANVLLHPKEQPKESHKLRNGLAATGIAAAALFAMTAKKKGDA